jgi:hypothetical protein
MDSQTQAFNTDSGIIYPLNSWSINVIVHNEDTISKYFGGEIGEVGVKVTPLSP